jgi:hypothetical protein
MHSASSSGQGLQPRFPGLHSFIELDFATVILFIEIRRLLSQDRKLVTAYALIVCPRRLQLF